MALLRRRRHIGHYARVARGVTSAVRILAIETTEAIGSLAAMCDGKLLAELKLDARQRSTQSFAPGLKALLQEVGWRPGEVNLVAVTVGPGSFTGLRVGVTAAKTFAYAAGADILGIDTLEAIAAATPEDVELVSTAVDAQRGDVVANSFRRGADGWFEPAGSARLIPAEAWLSGLAPGTAVSGPILRKLAAQVPKHLRRLDERYWPPTAGHVARLAARYHGAGRRDDVFSLLPRYCRQSAAEEKWGK